jgi:hypothetical protein
MARADAHGVFVGKLQLALRRALPVLRRAHLLLAVDDGALEREERDAVRAVEPVGLREHARHFWGALFFSQASDQPDLLAFATPLRLDWSLQHLALRLPCLTGCFGKPQAIPTGIRHIEKFLLSF